MKIKAEQKFVKITPRKLRLVADMVRKMEPREALTILPHLNKRGAKSVEKVIKTALANATNQGVNETDLVFDHIQITEGPRLKRFRPVSRGRAHGYVKRMSNIRVILTEQKKENKEVKDKNIKETSKTSKNKK